MFVGLPACPTTVTLGAFSQKPPVAGIAYVALPNTGFEKLSTPAIANVPFAMVRKPDVLAP